MTVDFIYNGQARGSVAAVLAQNNFDPGVLRPWEEGNRSYYSVTRNGKQVVEFAHNAATLRKDEWIHLDQQVVKAAKQRLRVVADLRAKGLQYSIPNGMGTTVLQTETQSDITDASVHMDALANNPHDRPVYDLLNLPLPVIHKDFHISARQLAASRNGGSPFDTAMAELAARKVAEEAEKMTVGTGAAFTYGGGSVYGLINHPNINTKDITSPTESGWTPALAVTEVLDMIRRAKADGMFGPYTLYCSTAWDPYMDADYSSAKGDNTLRMRLKQIGIEVETSDYLDTTGAIFRLVLVQMTSDVIRMVIGMEIMVLSWETVGGLQLNFKVMGILVPQIRADQSGNSGIVYGAAGL